MSLFPKITNPCPYKGKLSDILDGDVCRLCKREVHSLDDLSTEERIALIESCVDDEICVSYRMPAAALLSATVLMGGHAATEPGNVTTASTSEASYGDGAVTELMFGGLRVERRYRATSYLDGSTKRRKVDLDNWISLDESENALALQSGAKRGRPGTSARRFQCDPGDSED